MEGGHTGGAHISRQRSIVSLHWGAPVGKGAGVDHLSSLFLQFAGSEETQQQEREARPD